MITKTKFDNHPEGQDRYGEPLVTDEEGNIEYPEPVIFDELSETTKASIFGSAIPVTSYQFDRVENNCYVVQVAGRTIGVESATTATKDSAQAEIESIIFTD
jgi:hypothetical protein